MLQLSSIKTFINSLAYISILLLALMILPGCSALQPREPADTEPVLHPVDSIVRDDVVYAVTKEVFENFEEFKKLHPAYQVLKKKGMLEGMSAPIHPGAMKYYKEAGMM